MPHSSGMHAPEQTEPPETTPARPCGMVALVGRANVGKSSLLNRMLGEKVSAVSPVAQTTRRALRGIRNEPRGQIVLLDTPGVHRARSDLGRHMNRAARAAVEGVDAVALVFDRSRPPEAEDEGWIRRLLRAEDDAPGVVAVLNKCDLPGNRADAYRRAWEEAAAGRPAPPPVAWIEVSAVTGEGVDRLLDALFARLPVGPPLFPEDILTDYPRRLAVADVIREKLYGRLDDELPHRAAVEVDAFEETGEGWNVGAAVFVERPSQKGIVIGHKGRRLRAVRRAAEAELLAQLGHPVKIALRVKVEPHWTRNYWFLKRLGYVQ